jgi:hypothetical protein
VAMELMNKEARYNGPIGVYDAIRWPPNSKAVQFLGKAESTYSISELKNVKKLLPF